MHHDRAIAAAGILAREEIIRLLRNGAESAAALALRRSPPKHATVVHFRCAETGAEWHLSEIEPSDGDTVWGVIDLGFGPFLGRDSLRELSRLKAFRVDGGK